METLRVFIIEPADSMRESLAMYINNLGYEVVACSSPQQIPCYNSNKCECPMCSACGDVLLVGQHLPQQAGIDFIAERTTNGCQGLVENMAIICAPWSAREQERAGQLGCRWFETPLNLGELRSWLKTVAESLPENRQLTPLSYFDSAERLLKPA